MLRERVAHAAAQTAQVRSLREKFLGSPDATLAPTEALRLLRSPTFTGTAAAALSWEIHRIAGRFSWTEAKALWFVLTGEAPPLNPVAAQV